MSSPQDDGSSVTFTASDAARKEETRLQPRAVDDEQPVLKLNLDFMPQHAPGGAAAEEKKRMAQQGHDAHAAQVQQIVELIRSHHQRIEAARAEKRPYRIAVLGRTRKTLTPVAAALREAGIPFAAVDLEKLKERPEVLDALALARALLNPHDRIAWLGGPARSVVGTFACGFAHAGECR